MKKILSMFVLLLASSMFSSVVSAQTIYDCADDGANNCSDTVKRVGGLSDGEEPIDVCTAQCKTVKNSIQNNLNNNHANGKVWSCKVNSVTVTGTREDERYGGTLVYCDCDISCSGVAGIDPEPIDF